MLENHKTHAKGEIWLNYQKLCCKIYNSQLAGLPMQTGRVIDGSWLYVGGILACLSLCVCVFVWDRATNRVSSE